MTPSGAGGSNDRHNRAILDSERSPSFGALPDDLRGRLEADPERQRQSVPHRRKKHTACPGCTLEVHGCGQPYAVPEEATATPTR